MQTGLFTLEHMRYIVLFCVPAVLITVEYLLPTMGAPTQRARHTVRNLIFGVIWSVGSAFCAAGLVWLSLRCADAKVGLFNIISVPLWAQLVIGILVIDFVEYWRHYANHFIPLLWRLHRVHHSDPLMEASTTLRLHPVELAVVYGPRVVVVLLLGLSPFVLAIHALTSLTAQYFHHANFSLPVWLDKLIGLVIITPGQHFTHHMREQYYTDSQFGIIFPFWDRLLGTLRKIPDRKANPNGLDGWDSESDQTVFGMLASMFDHEERARMRSRVRLARS